MIFIENEAALFTMRNSAEMCKGICCYNLVYNFLIQLLPLKSSVFMVHFSNTFWYRKEAFPNGSTQNETVPLLVIFHLPYSKYRGVKICFYWFRYQNQNFSLSQCRTRFSVALVSVSHSCRTCVVRVALVSHSCHSCRTHVAFVSLVSLVSGARISNQTRSLEYAQIFFNVTFAISIFKKQQLRHDILRLLRKNQKMFSE